MRRMRWKALVPALTLLVSTYGCAASPVAVLPDRLEGAWSWVSASGGIAGRTLTPASEGYAIEVRFLADGEARMYRDGELRVETSYEVGVGLEGGSFPGSPVVRFDEPLLGGWDTMGVELVAGDQLLLVDGCCDGYAYRFDRADAP